MAISPNAHAFGNGDGLLLYPPSRGVPDDPIIAGPINSIRWENIREGLEDKEYFWLLERQLEQVRTPAPLDDNAKEAIREGEAALDSVNRLVRSLIDYETDPGKLYAARSLLAHAIENLSFISN
jgi:hypothetical protein